MSCGKNNHPRGGKTVKIKHQFEVFQDMNDHSQSTIGEPVNLIEQVTIFLQIVESKSS